MVRAPKDAVMMADYGGESIAPLPVSETVEKYLSKSISLSDILSRVLRGWLFALIGAGLGIVAGIYAVWVTPPSYTVTVTLLPLEAGSGDLSGGGGDTGLGVIAGLLGTNGPVPKFTRFVASLYTTSLAQAMDRKHDMICLSNSSCDPKTHRWRKDTGLRAWIGKRLAVLAHLPDPDRPKTAADLAAWTASNVVITTDRNSRMLLLSIDSHDPEFAKKFLLDLVDTANNFIKDQDNAIVKKNVAYVTTQLATNTNLSQREALTGLLSDEERHLMLTAVDLPYVASIQDGPNIETSNSAVKFLAAYTLFGFLAGAAIGIAISLLPNNGRFWRRYWTAP